MTEQTVDELKGMLLLHISEEERELLSLREGQERLEGKVDALLDGLAKNTEVCDEIRSLQATGRVLTRIIKWVGGMAAAGAGVVALMSALKTGTPSTLPPPGPH